MFAPERFAKPSPEYLFTNLEDVDQRTELVTRVNELTVVPVETNTTDLEFKTNGDTGGMVTVNDYPITAVGMTSLCKILGIPTPFRSVISNSLLETNIKRLQKERAMQTVNLLIRPDGTAAGIAKGEYDEINNSDVLNTFLAKPELKEVRLSELQLLIVLTFEEKLVASVDGLDNWYIGEYIHNSIIKDFGLHFFSGLYRTQCTNSYLAPYLGRVRANYSIAEHQQRLLRILDVVGARSTDEYGTMGDKIQALPGQLLNQRYAVQVWNGLSSILSKDEADTLLGLNEDLRKDLVANYSAWKADVKLAKLRRQELPVDVATSLDAYSVLNKITDHGKNVSNPERYELEKLGGKLLQGFLWN